jgi:anthranilate phosphoribosyltransferase
MKGPTIKEVASIARAMRANCEQIAPAVAGDLIDTCGTGGGQTTFNCSTTVALVAAAAGIPVAKHGSRSLASSSGSADVLERLGVAIDLSPRQAERLIERAGICSDFGLPTYSYEQLLGGDPQQNAHLLRAILAGHERGARRDMVIANAAGPLLVGGKAESLREGAARAAELIDSGAAMRKLDQLITESNQIAAAETP